MAAFLNNNNNNWADDFEEAGVPEETTTPPAHAPAPGVSESAASGASNVPTLPPKETKTLPDGTRLTTEWRWADDSHTTRIKTTRKSILRKVETLVPLAVTERKNNWVKFGAVAQCPPGPDTDSTTLGDHMVVRLSTQLEEDEDQFQREAEEARKLTIAKAMSCRICSQNHRTSKCPFKGTHSPLTGASPLGETAGAPATGMAGAPSMGMAGVVAGGGTGGSVDASGGGPARYVAPGRRPGATSSLELDAYGRPIQEGFSVRITNLIPNAVENDVRELVTLITPSSTVGRVYVARDKITGEGKGYSFATFLTKDAAQAVIDRLDGHAYGNLILGVDWAQPSKPR